MPTVLHVTTPRSWRGGEQQLAYLHDGLAALGVPQTVLCPTGSAVERVARERGWRCVAAPRRASVDLPFARAVARAVRLGGADVVHAHDPHGHAAAVLAASLLGMRAPVVAHRRVDFPIGRGIFSRWKYDHRAVRAIVCVSRAVAEIVRGGVRDPSRLRVVHDAVDPGRFAGIRPDGRLRAQYRIPPGVPLVGNVAALADHKDYFTFVDTAGILLGEGLDARFVAIGEGPLRPDLERYIRARGLETRVLLAGFRDDVPVILPELDVFLFTSKEEGLGSSILDAYLCRVPVVATAAGGIPEVVVDGETGLLAPPRDPAALSERVRRVLGDPTVRARLVEGGGRRVREFTVDRMSGRTLEIYGEVLRAPA